MDRLEVQKDGIPWSEWVFGVSGRFSSGVLSYEGRGFLIIVGRWMLGFGLIYSPLQSMDRRPSPTDYTRFL